LAAREASARPSLHYQLVISEIACRRVHADGADALRAAILVSREDLPRAVALGAVAFNLARAIGPALAGGIAAWLVSGSALVASSVCFVLMLVAAARMKKPRRSFRCGPKAFPNFRRHFQGQQVFERDRRSRPRDGDRRI
jgi:hypothetical protein